MNIANLVVLNNAHVPEEFGIIRYRIQFIYTLKSINFYRYKV